MPRSLTLLALLLTSLAYATPFADWRAAYESAAAPARDRLPGLWVGQCADSDAPEKTFPALYAYTQIQPGYDSQSHFFDRAGDPAEYDDWTLGRAQQDASVSRWLRSESWPSVFDEDGAIVNLFQTQNGASWIRGVRQSEGALYLRVTANDGRAEAAMVCRFTHRLTDAPPVPTGFIADSGASDGGTIQVKSRSPEARYRRVQVINQGTEPVEISSIQVETPAGWIALPDTIKIGAIASATFAFSDKGEPLSGIRCFLSGRTANLRFIGMP